MASPALLVERRGEGWRWGEYLAVCSATALRGHARGEVGGINRMHNLRRRPL